ncbi:MAG: PD40 domain-containing protein [Nitrospinae bacterium]|nr:PD40 domain-containing protein [Nitrospinota bacterium]
MTVTGFRHQGHRKAPRLSNKLAAVGVALAWLLGPLPPAGAEKENPKGMVYVEKRSVFLKTGTKTEQLTTSGRDREPVLSPDGQWVAFSREIPGKAIQCEKDEMEPYECADEQLWIFGLGNRSERMLLEPTPDPLGNYGIHAIIKFGNKTFSPDGKTVYFETRDGQLSGAIHAVGIDGGGARFVAPGRGLRVIKRVGMEEMKGLAGHLLVEQHRYFFSGGSYDWHWVIAPDGKTLEPVGDSIHLDDFARKLDIEYMESGSSSNSSHGRPFAKNGNIFLKNESGTARLTNSGYDRAPNLSPDGQWVAFIREIPGGTRMCKDPGRYGCATEQLWIYDLGNRSERLLHEAADASPGVKRTESITEFRKLTFSPDGKTVYFMTEVWFPPDAIHAIGVDGKNGRHIADGYDFKVIESADKEDWTGRLIVEDRVRDKENNLRYLYWLVAPGGENPIFLGNDFAEFARQYKIEYMEGW